MKLPIRLKNSVGSRLSRSIKRMLIIIGHTRRLAAIKLGLKEVPVKVASELTPEQCKQLRIADNATSAVSEWELEKADAGNARRCRKLNLK